ncbi:hypothetical protein ABZ721_37220 [Streptomyces sp. NPDC006733]|uniref:hypothetical protein n=1 Tax=Streptomyces sp. NPDC006733 TaxID=3155460 RepID=UPI0033C3A7DB
MDGADDQFSHVWEGSEEGWVVIRSEITAGAICNLKSSRLLVIEDDGEYVRAISLMLQHARPLLDDFP